MFSLSVEKDNSAFLFVPVYYGLVLKVVQLYSVVYQL